MEIFAEKENSTLLFTQLISFEGDEYDVKVAETKKERIALPARILNLVLEKRGSSGDI